MTKRTRTTKNKWYEHLHRLCIVHDVILAINPACVVTELTTPEGHLFLGGACMPDLRAIMSPDVTSSAQYVIVLHEMGHICHDKPRPGCVSTYDVLTTQDAHECMQEEDNAWEWAKAHAMEWTPSMEMAYQHGRESYRLDVVRRVKADLGIGGKKAAYIKEWK